MMIVLGCFFFEFIYLHTILLNHDILNSISIDLNFILQKINHQFFVFRRRILPRDLIKTSLFLGVLWSAFNSISYFHTYFSIADPSLVPLLLLALLLLYLFNPLNVALRSCRLWILKTTWRIICAPFYNVKFADFWLGDQLVSMAQVFKDVEFSSCFYFNKVR